MTLSVRCSVLRPAACRPNLRVSGGRLYWHVVGRLPALPGHWRECAWAGAGSGERLLPARGSRCIPRHRPDCGAGRDRGQLLVGRSHLSDTTLHLYRGWENDFSLPIASELNAKQRARYDIPISGRGRTVFATSPALHVVVLRDHISTPTNVEYRQKVRVLEDRFRAAMEAQGYDRVENVGDISIYVLRSTG